MHKIILSLGILALVWAAPQQMSSGDLDAVIAEIFGKPTMATTVGFVKPSTIVPPAIVNKNPDSGEVTKCQTDEGSEGVCVHYYLCNANNSIITDGVGVIDIRVGEQMCKSYLDVCCKLSETRDPTDPIVPDPGTQPPQITDPVIAFMTPNSESQIENSIPHNWELWERQSCGWRNPDGVGFRITGDKDGESKFGEFPWMVAILKIEPVNEDDPDGQRLNVYVGGGSLIHPSIVLTTAHYIVSTKTLRVRAGEWDTQTSTEIYPYQDRDVASVEIHKDFNKGNLFYDIALLFLTTPMEPAPNIGVVCLPPPRVRVPGGAQCLASGWGKDKFGKEGRYQVILKKVKLPVVDRRQCQSALRKTRLGNFFELHSSFMCAGGGQSQDTCKGDGGSPLVCPIEGETNRFMQSGIVAWGIGCGGDGTPGVYVDVSNLRSWIDDKVAGKAYDPSVYTI